MQQLPKQTQTGKSDAIATLDMLRDAGAAMDSI